MKYQEKFPGGDASVFLRSVTMKTIKEMSEILIFADINGQITRFVYNGGSIAISKTSL